MTADQRFAHRIVRLAGTSLVALGLVYFLWTARAPAEGMIANALLAGWILMPALLVASLRRPTVRYAVIVPAMSVGMALVGACVAPASQPAAARAGWLLVCAGVWFGGLLGAWFWFRLLPVPASLDDPFSRGRWVLITLHVAAIVAGLALVGASLLV